MKDQGSVVHAVDSVDTVDAEQDGLRFWQQMALAAAPDGAPQPPSMSVPAELHGALALLEASAEGSFNGGPSVPSAGALYPYEHYVITGGGAGPQVFSVDVPRRGCRLLLQGESVARGLEASGLALPGPNAFLVLIAVRPWLSMRKYDDRGYLYAQLDAAHLGTHLLCLAQRTHRRADWLTRTATGPLGDLLRFGGNYLLLHSVLLLDEPVESGASALGAWTCTDWRDLPSGPRLADGPEGRCWRGLVSHFRQRPLSSAPVHHRPLLPAPATPAPPVSPRPLATWADLASRRRSAKDFGAGELSLAPLQEALAALATPLMTDLAETDGFGATLVALQVAGLVPGAYPLRGAGALADGPTEGTAASGDDIVRLCMGQEHLRHTCAAVVFHARHQDLFRRGLRAVDEALLRVGSLAHLLYLGATGAGVAVTTIGGFDASRWHALAGLADEDEVLYVAMLGISGTSTVKSDRLQPAHAHGQR